MHMFGSLNLCVTGFVTEQNIFIEKSEPNQAVFQSIETNTGLSL